MSHAISVTWATKKVAQSDWEVEDYSELACLFVTPKGTYFTTLPVFRLRARCNTISSALSWASLPGKGAQHHFPRKILECFFAKSKDKNRRSLENKFLVVWIPGIRALMCPHRGDRMEAKACSRGDSIKMPCLRGVQRLSTRHPYQPVMPTSDSEYQASINQTSKPYVFVDP